MCTSALPVFTSHYVTINSYSFPVPSALVSVFTSHYVTINSDCVKALSFSSSHLHPTM